jgi:hypothetical protein
MALYDNIANKMIPFNYLSRFVANCKPGEQLHAHGNL